MYRIPNSTILSRVFDEWRGWNLKWVMGGYSTYEAFRTIDTGHIVIKLEAYIKVHKSRQKARMKIRVLNQDTWFINREVSLDTESRLLKHLAKKLKASIDKDLEKALQSLVSKKTSSPRKSSFWDVFNPFS